MLLGGINTLTPHVPLSRSAPAAAPARTSPSRSCSPGGHLGRYTATISPLGRLNWCLMSQEPLWNRVKHSTCLSLSSPPANFQLRKKVSTSEIHQLVVFRERERCGPQVCQTLRGAGLHEEFFRVSIHPWIYSPQLSPGASNQPPTQAPNVASPLGLVAVEPKGLINVSVELFFLRLADDLSPQCSE